MKVKELIRQLEWCIAHSDVGEDSEVSLTLHVHEWNTSGYYINVPVESVVVCGTAPSDTIEVEAVIDKKDVSEIVRLHNELERNDSNKCHGCGKWVGTKLFKHCVKCRVEFAEEYEGVFERK